jgi:hypothetical protein
MLAKVSSRRVSKAPFIIYCITHLRSGKRYVGQTQRALRTRWRDHVLSAGQKMPGCKALAYAIRKYGAEAFACVELARARTQRAADRTEMRWISGFACLAPRGYNLGAGGQGDHKRNGAATRRKMAEAARKRWALIPKAQRSEIARKGRAGMTAEQRSEIARKANAARTPEQRRAIALAKMTPENKRKLLAGRDEWMRTRTQEQRRAWADRLNASTTAEGRTARALAANAAQSRDQRLAAAAKVPVEIRIRNGRLGAAIMHARTRSMR